MKKTGVSYMESGLVGRVFSSDARVRYCAVVDRNGNVLTGGMRPGVKSLEPARETPKLHVQGAIHQGMSASWDEYLGEVDYVVVHRKKVSLVIFRLPSSKELVISVPPDYPMDQVILLRQLVIA